MLLIDDLTNKYFNTDLGAILTQLGFDDAKITEIKMMLACLMAAILLTMKDMKLA
ncbi:hypothetical protein [Dendronalium sp. ChiSLP03b]|uniref:hypothetical protein n=1 Tax=Dendronalium sp. ChiSLP03b TaxID=3075381 RepID=UPI002AD455F7|nr:hypothetical protein [Dendronalium sp. ChiSLP03b]MDZ8204361.1 hypothetical protein [Dendronalium sp. ChiSLP03b]